MQAKQDATALQEQSKAMKVGIKEAEEREKQLQEALEASVLPIGNLVHDSVPVSDDEVGGAGGCPGNQEVQGVFEVWELRGLHVSLRPATGWRSSCWRRPFLPLQHCGT